MSGAWMNTLNFSATGSLHDGKFGKTKKRRGFQGKFQRVASLKNTFQAKATEGWSIRIS